MTTETPPESDLLLQDPGDDIYRISGRKDAQSRLLAKKLHKLGFIYALYGALDGLSLSYSTVKYCFDLLLGDSKLSSSDIMHEWMLSPTGLATTITATATLVLLSTLANCFDDDDKKFYKRFIAISWPYIRDALKALKNSYKGIRSTLQLVDLFSGGAAGAMHFIMPLGIAFGGLTVLSRLWYRSMLSERKEMMKISGQLLEQVKARTHISSKRTESLLKAIQRQSMATRALALFSAGFSGSVDGLYLYIGVLTLCSLAPPALIAMTVFCGLYFLACIATRVNDEIEYQRKLQLAAVKVEFALLGKQVERDFKKLQRISIKLASQYDDQQLVQLQTDQLEILKKSVALFESKREEYLDLSTTSYTSAFIGGMKNGLAAYGALAGAMFAVATILILCSTSFPPALLIACVSVGMALLIGFTVYSMIQNRQHRSKQREALPPFGTLSEILAIKGETMQAVQALTPEKVKKTILGGMVVDPSPQFFFQEWFEVLRSFFSGMGKGSKAVDYTMNPLQAPDDNGHYHDTPVMVWVTIASSVLHAIVLALRAYARGLGRNSIEVPLVDAKDLPQEGPGSKPLALEPATLSPSGQSIGTRMGISHSLSTPNIHVLNDPTIPKQPVNHVEPSNSKDSNLSSTSSENVDSRLMTRNFSYPRFFAPPPSPGVECTPNPIVIAAACN